MIKSCYAVVLTIYFAVLSMVAHGQENLSVQVSENTGYTINSYAVFNDSDLDWQTVAATPWNETERQQGTFRPLGDAWIRLDIGANDLKENSWILNLGTIFGGILNIYVVRDGELVKELNINSYESFQSRQYDHRQIVLPFELSPNSVTQVLIQLQSSTTYTVLNFNLEPERQFTISDRQETWLFGLQFGIIAALALYHLILAGATRDKVYWLYSAYIVGNLYYYLVTTGYGYQYFWSDQAWITVALGPIVLVLPTVLAIPFAVTFLKLRSISPKIAYCFWGLFSILLVSFVITYVGAVNLITFINVVINLTYIAFIAAGIYALIKGVVFARFFLIAWTIHCLALVNFVVSVSYGGVYQEVANLVMSIGFDLQIFLLALALAHRIRSMRNAQQEAEADNRAKSIFLARMSHEIRTPLSGILGVSELLAEKLKDKDHLHYNDIIRSSGKSLLTVINDILDYSKFSSGDVELEKIPFSIQRLAGDSLDVFRVKTAETGIELIVNIEPDFPEFLLGDPTRVKQIILNLVGNAVKFTEVGQIVLSVQYADKNRDMVKLTVSDTGPGIKKEEQEKLFTAFSQANSSTSRKYGGTGLGLTICKELAAIMDGEIGVESELGKGSSFWVTLQLPASDEEKTPINYDSINLSGLRLLIVEDSYTFADLLLVQAHSWGMEAEVARTGEQALEILRRSHDEEKYFDIISLDLFMPKMDGLETSRHIQLDYRFNKIPKLLLTSSNSFPSKEQLKSAGISRVLEKPTLPADLKNIYKQLLVDTSEVVAQTTDTVEKEEIAQLRVLVAEDNKVNQTVISGILQRFNQVPDMVDDGTDAVVAVTENDRQYDLILMDCEMQDMDGLEATRKIREWEFKNQRSAVTIVALTAHVLPEQMQSCYDAGMDAYLTKPIDIDKVEELLLSLSSNIKPSSRSKDSFAQLG